MSFPSSSARNTYWPATSPPLSGRDAKMQVASRNGSEFTRWTQRGAAKTPSIRSVRKTADIAEAQSEEGRAVGRSAKE